MLPRSVKCQDCGQIALVRGYGRVEYDWPETTTPDPETTIPTIKSVRLTIDCPRCGVNSQEFYPGGAPPADRTSVPAPAMLRLRDRQREVRFQRIGPLRRLPS
jgi:hypothetical protein